MLYDRLPWNAGLVLDLQFREGVGELAHDHSREHHVLTMTGLPSWADGYLDFDPSHPDFLVVDSAVFDFTVGDFTLMAWVYYGGVGFRYLMCRGLTDADGWEWAINANSALWLRTNQAGAHQDTVSANGAVPVGEWALVGMTRSGANVLPYINGRPSVGTLGAHIAPLTSARELHVGINDAEAAGFYAGGLRRPRVWSRALTVAEHLQIFNLER